MGFFVPTQFPNDPDPRLRTLYSHWGEIGIRTLVSQFYDKIAISKIKEMFPKDLTLAKEKQADFMIQVLGGPAFYVQKNGPPRMRQRHFAFQISEDSRRIWLQCYRESLEESEFPEDEKQVFLDFLDSFSQWMVNFKED